ncbi:MAG: trypsin-like peptidase domain-containing protein [Propionibacteriaceae bacterium]|nr:trypsin-like peptidase domain-containing protein [Propionibacteriaceae bacterium]
MTHRLAAFTALAALIFTGCSVPNTPPPGQPGTPTPGPTVGTTAPATDATAGADQARRAADGEPDWAQIVERVSPAAVAVSVRGGGAAGQGSGVVIDDRGHIATNHHVVAAGGGNAEVMVTLHDNRVLPARIVGTDPASDLAVLVVEGVQLESVSFGDDSQLRVGDPVLAVGNPLGLAGTVTAGIVSALDRPVTTVQGGGRTGGGEPVVTNAIQTDAAINPGNSGGALVNSTGELVGINSSIATMGQPSGNIGIGFAITATQVRSITDQLIETGEAQHSFLGVSVVDTVAQVDAVGVRAAGIARVDPGTPTAGAGLREGDAVAALDGEAIDSGLALTAQVRERRPGTQVTLGLIRDGQRSDLEVTLAERP